MALNDTQSSWRIGSVPDSRPDLISRYTRNTGDCPGGNSRGRKEGRMMRIRAVHIIITIACWLRNCRSRKIQRTFHYSRICIDLLNNLQVKLVWWAYRQTTRSLQIASGIRYPTHLSSLVLLLFSSLHVVIVFHTARRQLPGQKENQVLCHLRNSSKTVFFSLSL